MAGSFGRHRSGSRTDQNIAGLYDLERTLGSGHFAVVKLARHVFTGEKVAVKVIDKTKLDDVARAHLYQEVRCMKLVQHPNVVRLYEVIDTQTKLYLILEFGDGGDMYDHIMKHEGQGISETKAKHYFRQIVSAIDYCHKLHVVHRDLKPENVIFFKSQDVAKLTDFGFSNNFLPGEKLYTSCGSLAYSAPEILLGDSYEAPAVDVWSLGVILYMMVCGSGPFSHSNDSETLTMIMDCKYDLPAHLSPDCKSLISRMLVRQPEKRASLESIADDPWLVDSFHPLHASHSLSPLISDIKLTPDIHLMVIQKMEAGSIAARDEIKRSLEDDKYDHVTATYFLLAERVLKKRHGSGPFHVKLEESESYPYDDLKSASDPNLLDVESDGAESGSASPEPHRRKSSGSFSEKSPTSSPRWQRRRNSKDDLDTGDTHLEVTHSSEDLNENNATFSTEFAPRSHSLQPRSHRMTYPTTLLKKTLSSPNLLNEISEEHESDIEESPRNSPKASRKSPGRRRKYDPKRHGCRLSPIHSRRSSCSSSDDDEMQMLERRVSISSVISSGRGLHGCNGQSDSSSKGSSSGGKHAVLSELDSPDKENNMNLGNLTFIPKKIFVASRDARIRNFSDSNLVTYNAQYRYAILQNTKTKCSSDTNLMFSFNKKKALPLSPDVLKVNDLFKLPKRLSFTRTSSSKLPPSSRIDEESPTDISPDTSPVMEHSRLPCSSDQPNENSLRSLKTQKNLEFCSLDEISDTDSGTETCRKTPLQNPDSINSQRGSKTSLKYIYSEPNSENNTCYTINESQSLPGPTTSEQKSNESLSGSKTTVESDFKILESTINRYSPANMGRVLRGSTPLINKSQCCILL